MVAPRLLALLLYLGLLLPPGPALARQDDPRLPDLFARLKAAASPAEAAPLEAQIWAIWQEAPDPEGGALLAAADEAIVRRDYPGALDKLDALVRHSPNFAEAWNKRATVSYLIGDYRASVEDIRRTLALEPHHFGALSGLGLIYVAINEPRAAVKSFAAALAIDPFLPGAKAQIERLKDEVDGAPL